MSRTRPSAAKLCPRAAQQWQRSREKLTRRLTLEMRSPPIVQKGSNGTEREHIVPRWPACAARTDRKRRREGQRALLAPIFQTNRAFIDSVHTSATRDALTRRMESAAAAREIAAAFFRRSFGSAIDRSVGFCRHHHCCRRSRRLPANSRFASMSATCARRCTADVNKQPSRRERHANATAKANLSFSLPSNASRTEGSATEILDGLRAAFSRYLSAFLLIASASRRKYLLLSLQIRRSIRS